MTQEFFKTVQNKLLYAVTGFTAAEIIHKRANASDSEHGTYDLGWCRSRKKTLKSHDVEIAKNYLKHEEIKDLELLVSQYLDFAERQARQRKILYMADWKTKLDAFLQLNDDKILTHAGKISAEMAKELALSEYAKFEENRKKAEFTHAEKELREALNRVMGNREVSEQGEK